MLKTEYRVIAEFEDGREQVVVTLSPGIYTFPVGSKGSASLTREAAEELAARILYENAYVDTTRVESSWVTA